MSQQEVQLIEVDYNFRKSTDGLKRDTVSLQIAVPTPAAVIEILQDTTDATRKARAAIMDAVYSVVTGYVRTRVDADDTFNQETLDHIANEVTFDAIANLAKSERTTATKAELEAFAAEYIRVMPTLAGISVQGAESAGNIFVAKVKNVVGNDAALLKLQARLHEYLEKAPDESVQQHSNAVDYLLGRLGDALSINYDASAL